MKFSKALGALCFLFTVGLALNAEASSFTCVARPASIPMGASAFVTIEDKAEGPTLLTYSYSNQAGIETHRETLPVHRRELHMGTRYSAEGVELYVHEQGYNVRFTRAFANGETLELDLVCGSRAPLGHFPG